MITNNELGTVDHHRPRPNQLHQRPGGRCDGLDRDSVGRLRPDEARFSFDGSFALIVTSSTIVRADRAKPTGSPAMRSAIRRNAAPLAIIVAIATLIAGAAIYNSNQLDSSPLAPASSTPSPPASPPAPGNGTGVAPLILNPSIPGWNPVRSVRRAAVYDVPPAWRVLTEDTISGYENNNGKLLVAGSGSARFGEGSCAGSTDSLALSTTKHSPAGIDLARVSAAQAQEWAEAAFLDDYDRPPSVTLGSPEALTTPAGQQAVIVKATATPATMAGDCKVARGAVYAISATGYRGELGPTVSLIIVVDEQITGAQPVPESEIRQILPTLRPAS